MCACRLLTRFSCDFSSPQDRHAPAALSVAGAKDGTSGHGGNDEGGSSTKEEEDRGDSEVKELQEGEQQLQGGPAANVPPPPLRVTTAAPLQPPSLLRLPASGPVEPVATQAAGLRYKLSAVLVRLVGVAGGVRVAAPRSPWKDPSRRTDADGIGRRNEGERVQGADGEGPPGRPVGFSPAGALSPVRPAADENRASSGRFEPLLAFPEEQERRTEERGESKRRRVNEDEAEDTAEERAQRAPEAEEDEEGDEKDCEHRAPKVLARVAAPTRAMRDEHEASGHATYRPWCAHCVEGRGRSRQHRKVDRDVESEIPVVSMDYGFLGPRCQLCDEDDVDVLVTFVGARDRKSKGIAGIAVLEKGSAQGYAAERLEKQLAVWGHGLVCLRSDGERAIKTVKNEVRARRKQETTIPEQSPLGDHAANGEAEQAVQAIAGLLRTNKAAIESNIGGRLGSQLPILKWMIEYVGTMHYQYNVGETG